MTILGYKHLSSQRFDYRFECPEGVWKARLDAKAWGKKRNLLLYFSEAGTENLYALSVFWTNGYRAQQGGHCFKGEAEPGEFFQLETAKTRTGTSKLVSAIKIPADGIASSRTVA